MFSYAVVVSTPQRAPGKQCNADAVAATLANAVHEALGPRQMVMQALDLRNPQHRAHVTTLLTRARVLSVPTTPLFYSFSDGVFTKPGLISLQLALDVVSQVLPSPTRRILEVLLEFPERHDLNFTDAWATAMETAETPEHRLSAHQQIRGKAPQFPTQQRAPVTGGDLRGGGGGAGAGSGSGGWGGGGMAAGAGYGSSSSSSSGPPPHQPPPGLHMGDDSDGMARESGGMDIASMRGVAGAPQSSGSSDSRVVIQMAEGMGTYADLSVASHITSVAHIPTGINAAELSGMKGVSGGVGAFPPGYAEQAAQQYHQQQAQQAQQPSIEQRALYLFPQIMNVNESKRLSERDMIKSKVGTDEASTQREIRQARIERAKLKRARPGEE